MHEQCTSYNDEWHAHLHIQGENAAGIFVAKVVYLLYSYNSDCYPCTRYYFAKQFYSPNQVSRCVEN